MKSITPVISVILLVLITIIASVTAFFFVNNIETVITTQATSQSSETNYCSRIRLLSMDSDVIKVQNNGCGTIDSVVVLINGEPTTFNLDHSLVEGEVGEILVTNLDIGDYEVIVMLDNGLTQKIIYNATVTSTNFVYNYPISYFAEKSNLNVENNLPNITYIRLPHNANITSLYLTINSPKVFSENSLDFQLDLGDMIGMGDDKDNNILYFLYDLNDSDSSVSVNINKYIINDNEVVLSNVSNILNISINPSYDTSSVVYHDGFIHGVIQTSSTELFYFNYSLSTYVLFNSTITMGEYKILDLKLDNENNKYWIYSNDTDSPIFLFVSSTKNGGFFDFSVNSSILDMQVLKESNPFIFYFDNSTDIFHVIASRKYNESQRDGESYRDVVYVKSEDFGVTWSAPETIVDVYGYDYENIGYSNFLLTSNTAGDLVFIHGEGILGGTETFVYKKSYGGSWQKISTMKNCINFFMQTIIINEDNLKFFCLPIKGIINFEDNNVYYSSNNFGSSWTGPYEGFTALTEGEIPINYLARVNDEGNLMGLSLDINFEAALESGMDHFPGGIGYRVEGNPFISLKVGNSYVLTNHSLNSRSYSVDIKAYVNSYLSSCSHSCDVPIYIDSNSSVNISLSVSGNYQLNDFQMYSLNSGITKQLYSNIENTQNLYFNVLKNKSISGVTTILNFKNSSILNEYVGVDARSSIKGLSVYGDKDLFIISSVKIHDDNFFDLNISKSTNLGKTWTNSENLINNCAFIEDVGVTHISMDLKDNYVHGFVNRTIYFNYSLSSKILITQNFSEVFVQDMYTSKLSNDLFIFYMNLTDDLLYFSKNNDYQNAVKINDSLFVNYSDIYDYYIPGGGIVENEAGIHFFMIGMDGSDLIFYYFNSSNNGISWSTHEACSFAISSGGIFPLNVLANEDDIFIYWSVANVDPFNPSYSYVRYIDGVWSSITQVYGPTYFTADNNGSTIYAGVNIPENMFPRNNNAFFMKSEDFGATWTTPTYGFKNFNTTTVAAHAKFFFDMPYVYGFYIDFNPFPTLPFSGLNRFVELKSVNPKLSINNNIVWQTSGAQNGLINVSAFNSTINSYVLTCQTESCTIPFLFNSSANNNFELSYFGITTNATKCSVFNPCEDNNVCTYNNCIDNACQFMPITESNVTGCTLTTGCFNEYRGEYGVSCRCLNGRCKDSCGDNVCQAWESSSFCAEDCLGFFPNQIIQLNEINEMSGSNVNYGMCAFDFTNDGNVEIVTVKKTTNGYNLTIYNHTNGDIVFEREKFISHSADTQPLLIHCGNLTNSNLLKVIVAGEINGLTFIDVINITSSMINVENSSEFYLVNESDTELENNFVSSLVVGDLDNSGDNEIYLKGYGYNNSIGYNLIYRYNYTNNALILDDKKNVNGSFLLNDMVISNFNDSTSSNELVFTSQDSNSINLVIYSYDNGLKLDNIIYLSSVINRKTPIYSKDIDGDNYDEILIMYQISSSPIKTILKIYSIDSGVLSVLDSQDIIIDSKNTHPMSLIVDNFDSNSGDLEIVLSLMNGYCPGGLDSYFMIYNYSNNQLNFESKRKINDFNGLKFANYVSYVLNDFQSADLNKDSTPDLLMSGFLSDSQCSMWATYYNSFVFFEYRDD
jgi:hypothetical protein